MRLTIFVILIVILVMLCLAFILSLIKVKHNKINNVYFYTYRDKNKIYKIRCSNFWETLFKYYIQTLINIILFNV